MGDRGEILMKNSNKWLYTHWGGYELNQTIRTALKKSSTEEELINNLDMEEVDCEHADIEHPIVIIDWKEKIISFKNPEWEHNKIDNLPEPMPFKIFIKTKFSWEEPTE